jgi:hypothetical protein
MDTAKIFTFKQRANELMKALKRQWTLDRQAELESIERQLKDIGQSIIKSKSAKS